MLTRMLPDAGSNVKGYEVSRSKAALTL